MGSAAKRIYYVLLIHSFWAEKKCKPAQSALFHPVRQPLIGCEYTSSDPGCVAKGV